MCTVPPLTVLKPNQPIAIAVPPPFFPQLPQYTAWMNSFRCCFLSVHAWVAFHLCLLVFLVDGKKEYPTGSMGYIKWKVVGDDKAVAKMITLVRR